MCSKYNNLLVLYNENVLLVIVVAIVFFADTVSITVISSTHSVTEVLFKYLLVSQISALGFKL